MNFIFERALNYIKKRPFPLLYTEKKKFKIYFEKICKSKYILKSPCMTSTCYDMFCEYTKLITTDLP
ncbi:hypothetical protein BLOT_009223 [Blomia tropicalis]|nr:hypothetical protein BLOT_009223 [Blomia tropicalis]